MPARGGNNNTHPGAHASAIDSSTASRGRGRGRGRARGQRENTRGRGTGRGRGRGGRSDNNDRPVQTPSSVPDPVSVRAEPSQIVTKANASSSEIKTTLPYLPLRIIKRILGIAAYHDARLDVLAHPRETLDRAAFPFLTKIGSLNSWARAYSAKLLETVVIIRDVPDAEAFIAGSDQGTAARVVIVNTMLQGFPPSVLEGVLRTASGVEQLAIEAPSGPSVPARLFKLESLSNLKGLHLGAMTLEECRDCKAKHHDYKPVELSFALDRLTLAGGWYSDFVDVNLVSALLNCTQDRIDIDVNPGISAFTRTDDTTPTFYSSSFTHPLPIKHLGFHTVGSDPFVIASFAPFLGKLCSLQSLTTTVAGPDIALLIESLPKSTPLKKLELSLAKHNKCDFMSYDYEFELALFQRSKMLQGLDTLVLVARGNAPDRRRVAQSCQSRNIKLQWLSLLDKEVDARFNYTFCLCAACAFVRRTVDGDSSDLNYYRSYIDPQWRNLFEPSDDEAPSRVPSTCVTIMTPDGRTDIIFHGVGLDDLEDSVRERLLRGSG